MSDRDAIFPGGAGDRPGQVRFYGVVTLGNLIMMFGTLVPILIWGIRLEGRVDQEAILRVKLEQRVSEFRDERRHEVAEIKKILARISDDVTSIRVQIGDNGNNRNRGNMP